MYMSCLLPCDYIIKACTQLILAIKSICQWLTWTFFYLAFSKICQLDKLEQETVKWCREILRNSPTAIRVLKSALNAVDDGHAGLQVILSSKQQIFHCYLAFKSDIQPSFIIKSGTWRKCHPHLLRNWRR